MAAKKTAKAAGQHKLEVTLNQISRAGCMLVMDTDVFGDIFFSRLLFVIERRFCATGQADATFCPEPIHGNDAFFSR